MALGNQINGVTKMKPQTELGAIYYHFSKGLVLVYVDRGLIEVCPVEPAVSPYKIDFNSLPAEDKLGATTAEELADIYAEQGFFLT